MLLARGPIANGEGAPLHSDALEDGRQQRVRGAAAAWTATTLLAFAQALAGRPFPFG